MFMLYYTIHYSLSDENGYALISHAETKLNLTNYHMTTYNNMIVKSTRDKVGDRLEEIVRRYVCELPACFIIVYCNSTIIWVLCDNA